LAAVALARLTFPPRVVTRPSCCTTIVGRSSAAPPAGRWSWSTTSIRRRRIAGCRDTPSNRRQRRARGHRRRRDGIQLVAPVAGVLRGLSARGARVDAGAIVAEIDPRDVAENCYGLDERGVRVSEGVLASLEVRALSRGASPGRPHGIDVVRHA